METQSNEPSQSCAISSVPVLCSLNSKGQGRWWLWKELVGLIWAVVLLELAMGLGGEGMFLQNTGSGEVTVTELVWQCTREAY